MEDNFVIDKDYRFDAMADGARPSCYGSCDLHVKLTHEDVMEMGRYFLKEDPYEVDDCHDWGLKDLIDAGLAESIAEEMKEQWEADNEGEEDPEEMPDFEERGWDSLEDLYACWDEDLKSDCIKYYKEHGGEDPVEEEDEEDDEGDE